MLKYTQLFTDLLDSKGLHYNVFDGHDGDTILRIAFDNATTTFVFSGDDGEYVSMYTPVEHVPEEKTIDLLVVCNDLNKQYKWLKFYIDDDNDVCCEDDAILTDENAADECLELLFRRLSILEKSKKPIMLAIYQ